MTSIARERLCTVRVRLDGFIAILRHDLGESQEAGAWFDTAVSVASESIDPRLLAWLDARRATIAINYGSAHEAPALATKAAAVAAAALDARCGTATPTLPRVKPLSRSASFQAITAQGSWSRGHGKSIAPSPRTLEPRPQRAICVNSYDRIAARLASTPIRSATG